MDTVHLWSNSIADLDMEKLASRLSNPRLSSTADKWSVYGNLQNMKIALSPSFISIKGSLPVFYFGDNIHLMTRADIKRAGEKLSDLLHIDISEAKTSRADIAYNFVTKYKPKAYYPYLLGSRHYYRQTDKSTLLYMNGSSQFCIYDKIEEAAAKKVLIPDIYTDKNLIRLEYRAIKNPAKIIKVSKLDFKSLHDEKIYIKLIDKWADTYTSIKKAPNLLTLKSMDLKKPNDLKQILAALAAQHLGHDTLMNILEEAKSSQVFKHKNYYNRMKAEINELLTIKTEGSSFDMTEELDKNVNQIRQFYR